jgi:hypothetical protein
MKTATPIPACLLLLIAAAVAGAQPVVTPTPDRPDEIATKSNYTVSNSFEAGYRFANVTGNHDAYRSAVNYGNGMRLFEGQLRVNSVDGKGSLFDEFAFHTMGQGQDPYQSTTLRIEKNAAYRYDMRFRIVNYFNRLPSLWQGEHGLNSERIFQTHELTLFPGKRFEVVLGYDRNNHNGPGFSSEGIASNFGALRRDRFLRLTTNLRQLNNQYRAGVNFRVAGLAVSFLQGFDNYREDTLYGNASTLPGAAANVQPVESLDRAEPIHGNTPFTSVVIRTENEHRVGFHGRFTYASGSRNAILGENLIATDPANTISSLRQTFVVGDADRKQGSGDFTVTLLPSDKWTITNTTAANNTRINGQSAFVEATIVTSQFLAFEHLGIRFVSNITEANFRPVPKFGLYGAYRYSARRIRTDSALDFPDFDFQEGLFESGNHVHSGVAGFRWLPVRGLRISVDAEKGRADQPLSARSDRDFHTETARVQWRRKNAVLSASFQNSINRNPVSLIDHRSESRQFGVNGSWAASDGRFTLDAGYTLLNLDTQSGILNYLNTADLNAASFSFYTSNLNLVNFGTRIQPHPRLTLYLGYNLAKDTGDDRSQLTFPTAVTPNYPNFASDGTSFFNSYPLSYQSPQARLSVRLGDKLSWNFGWQFYNYSEDFSALQNYHAHVGYSSFRWSF